MSFKVKLFLLSGLLSLAAFTWVSAELLPLAKQKVGLYDNKLDPPTLEPISNKLLTVLPVAVPPNYSPYLDPIADWRIVAGRALQIRFTASDPENEPLTFSLSIDSGQTNPLALGATLIADPSDPNRAAIFSWTPTLGQVSWYRRIKLTTSDNRGHTHSRLFSIKVDDPRTEETIEVPKIVGLVGSRLGTPLEYQALAVSNYGGALEYNFSLRRSTETASVDYGWRASNRWSFTPSEAGVYVITVKARSLADPTVVSTDGVISVVVTGNGELASAPRPLDLTLVGPGQVELRFYSNPDNAGQIAGYRLRLSRLSSPSTVFYEVAIPADSSAPEPPVYIHALNILSDDFQRILPSAHQLLRMYVEALLPDGTYRPFFAGNSLGLAGFLLPHNFLPAIDEIRAENITDHSADLVGVVNNPGDYYTYRLRLYRGQTLVEESGNNVNRFRLTGLNANRIYSDYTLEAVPVVNGVVLEWAKSARTSLFSFRTARGDQTCTNCWTKLNRGNPLDPGEGLATTWAPYLYSVKNNRGDLIYLLGNNPNYPGTLAGRFRSGGTSPEKKWEIYTDRGWSSDPADLPSPVSGLTTFYSRYSGMKLLPLPGDDDGIFGLAGVPFGGVRLSKINMDMHGFPANLLFDGETWKRWFGSANYDPHAAVPVIDSWTPLVSDFAFDPVSQTGIAVGIEGYWSQGPELVATKYYHNDTNLKWHRWDNTVGNWVGHNTWPWTRLDWIRSAFVLNPNGSDPATFSRPHITYLGGGNYLVVFRYGRDDQTDQALSAVLYQEGANPSWSWWDGASWRQGAPYAPVAISGAVLTGNDVNSIVNPESLLATGPGQATLIYQKDYRLYSIDYDDSHSSWGQPQLIDDGQNYAAVVAPDNTIWLYYSPDSVNVWLRRKAPAGAWSAPELLYSPPIPSTLTVQDANFVGAQNEPLVFIVEWGEGTLHLYALGQPHSPYWAGERARAAGVNRAVSQPLHTGRIIPDYQLAVSQSYSMESGPMAIDADGYLYLPHTGGFAMSVKQKDDVNPANTKMWGSGPVGNNVHLYFPGGVAVDSRRGKVYLSNGLSTGGGGMVGNSGNIRIFEQSWRTQNINDAAHYPPAFASGLGWPADLALDEARGFLYVTNALHNRIDVYDVEHLRNGLPVFLRSFGAAGRGNGQFDLPQGIDLDPEGNVYVVDTGNHQVQKFDSAGRWLTSWGSLGTAEGQFYYPFGIAVDPTYNLVYITDPYNSRIQIFDRRGNFLYTWSEWGSGSSRKDLGRTSGIAADGEGNIYTGAGYSLVKFKLASPEIDNDNDRIPDLLEEIRHIPSRNPLISSSNLNSEGDGDNTVTLPANVRLATLLQAIVTLDTEVPPPTPLVSLPGGGPSGGGGSAGPRTLATPPAPSVVPAAPSAVPPLPSLPSLRSTLRAGMRGEEVRTLQRMLARYFRIDEQIFTNGNYDRETIEAVKIFQRRERIVSRGTPETTGYGLVGPRTRARLNRLFSNPGAVSNVASSQVLINQLQQLLAVLIRQLAQLRAAGQP